MITSKRASAWKHVDALSCKSYLGLGTSNDELESALIRKSFFSEDNVSSFKHKGS